MLTFALRRRGLTQEDEQALAALPSAKFTAISEQQLEFTCLRSELETLAPTAETASLLLLTQTTAQAPPPDPKIMGIVNVTPDSFSDGGLYLDPESAVEHGLQLEAEGAAVLDVGGESTRPGARPVSAAEELERVLPVVRGLARQAQIPVSIDTTKASVARAALDCGATWVNDISACEGDEHMLPLIAEREARVVLMHALGNPEQMQEQPTYSDPVDQVSGYLRERVADCLKAGIDPSRILVDPGVGFGKRLEHNLALLRDLPQLRGLGLPLLVGVSRKSFIAHITGSERQHEWKGEGRRDNPSDRKGGTAAAVTACVLGGAEYLRVHDVALMSEAAAVAAALRPEHSRRP